MNKFFKRLALLLAVLMIVSMMPVQLFATNGVITYVNNSTENGEEQSNATTQNKAVASYELNNETISFEGETIREVNNKMREYWEVDNANGCSYNADKLPADGTGKLTWTIYGTVDQGEYLNSGALILPNLSGGYIYASGTYQWKNIAVVAGDENATIVSNDTFDVSHCYFSNSADATITFTGITLDGSFYAIPNGTVTFDGCVFKGMLRVPNGDGTVKVANCQFVGDADEDSTGNKNEYPLFFQAGGTLEFIGNTIAADTYKRGMNVGGSTELNVTIENNTIGAVTAGYSAIQLSGSVTDAKIKDNKISLDGTNALTLHSSLISDGKITEITVEGNTITGNGYLIYDDAVANSKAFTSENLTLTIGTNTVASTVDTTQGVKGSNKYGLSETVDTVVKSALTPTYVATVNGVGYATLAEAIAAANGNGTVTLLTATTELVQAMLDGQYGSIDGLTIELPAGDYGQLELGRATKYAGSNTTYHIGGFDAAEMTFDDFYAAKNGATWTAGSYYIRSMSNVTIKAADGAAVKVAGVKMSSGHIYGATERPVYDYVLDKTITDNGGYYLAQIVSNIAFEGITFTAKSDINTSIPESFINGFAFKNCVFDINNTASGNYAIRYYNENNNGNVSDLVVDGCTFNSCYQGVYTSHIKNIAVTNSKFYTTGHNAIAIQDFNGNCDHGDVVISGNYFENVGDRIIRFGNVGEGTTITITGNTSVNSGDANGEIIKAQTMPDSVNVSMASNTWGDVNGKTAVLGNGFKPVAATIDASKYETLDEAIKAAQDDDVIVINESNEYKLNGSLTYTGKAFTIKAADGVKASFDMSSAVALHGAKITFEDIIFNYSNKDYVGLQHSDTLVYNRCTINGKVFLYANSETFNKCNFVQSTTDYNVWTYGAKKVVFNGCIFDCKGKAVNAYTEADNASDEAQTIEVNGVTVNSTVANKAFLNIKNTTRAYEVTLSGDNKVNGLDANGTTKSNLYQVEKTDITESGKTVKVQEKAADGTLTTVYEVKIAPKPVAKVGEVEFFTLAEALAAVTKVSPLTWVSETVWSVDTPVYYNGNFYKSHTVNYVSKGALDWAIEAANADNSDEVAKIYVRPGYNTENGLVVNSHQNIKTSIAIYGNDASLKVSENKAWEPCVEYPGAGYHTLTKDISIEIYNLHDGASVWGQRMTNFTVDVTMENCKNVHELMINGQHESASASVTNYTVRNCTFDGTKCAAGWPIATTSAGTIVVEKCTFDNVKCPANINNKNGGNNTVTFRDCAFNDCYGVDGSDPYLIRIIGRNSDSKMIANFENLAFTNTDTTKYADIMIGSNELTKNLANVSYTITGTSGTMNSYRIGETTAETTVLTGEEVKGNNAVAVVEVVYKDGTSAKFATFEEAFAATESGSAIKLLANVEIASGTLINRTLDLNGFTATTSSLSTKDVFTLRDSSADANGKLVLNGTAPFYVNHNFTLESGTIESNVDIIVNFGTLPSFNMNDGTLILKNGATIACTYSRDVTINGGTIITDAGKSLFKIRSNSDNLSVKISGGDFTQVGKLTESTSNIKFSISGGKFSFDIPEDYCAKDYYPAHFNDGTMGVKKETVSTEEELRRALYEAALDGSLTRIKLTGNITLEMLYAAENFGTETIADNAIGDTFNRYKLGVHPTAEDPNHWNKLVTDQTLEECVVYGAYYHAAATDERIARLVIKAGQNVVIDLNGYTIEKNARATHGDWSNVCTDIIGNYGTLEIKDSAGTNGTIKGNGYISCNGAVLHNYEGGVMTVGAVNVDGNAAGMTAGTGQYVIANDGGKTTINGTNVYDTATSASLVVNTAGEMTITGNATLNHPATKTINVKGGNVVIESATIISDASTIYAAGGKTTITGEVTVNGTGKMAVNGGEIVKTATATVGGVPEGYAWFDNDDSTQSLGKAYAKIGETYYKSLADALAAANAGDTIVLLDNVTLNSPLTISKDVTIDLNKNTIDTKAGVRAFTITSGNVTIKNGTVKMGTVVNGSTRETGYTIYVNTAKGENVTLNLEDVTVIGGENQKSGVTDATVDALKANGMYSYTTEAGTALYIYGKNSDGNTIVNIKNSTIIGGYGSATNGTQTKYISGGANMADGGDAITAIGDNVVLTITDGSTIKGGDSDLRNAGIGVELQSGTLTVDGSTVTGGSCLKCDKSYGMAGDAVYVGSAAKSATIKSSTVIGGNGGYSYDGSGVEIRKNDDAPATVTIEDSTIKSGNGENANKDYAGAIYLGGWDDSTDLTLKGDNTLAGSDGKYGVIRGGVTDGIKLDGNLTIDEGTLKDTLFTEVSAGSTIKSGENATVDAGTVVSSDENAAMDTTPSADGTYSFVAAVAQVIDRAGKKFSYASIEDAFAAANDGETIKLLADVTANVVINKNLTLDLNGCTINGGTNNSKPTLTVNATVTVKDSSEAKTGTIKRDDTADTKSHYVIDIQGANAELIFESGNVINGSGVVGVKGASLIRVGNDSDMNAIPKLTINGGKFQQDNFIAIKVDYGTLVVNGGEITSANSYAIENWKTATINGGTINGSVASWTYSGGADSTLTIAGGTINGDVTSVNYGNTDSKLARVSITGGIVNGSLDTRSYDPKANELNSINDAAKANIEVSGGTFAKSFEQRFCAKGFELTENADGTYGVKAAMKGSKNYPYTLAELSVMTRAEYIAAQEALGGTMYVEVGNYSYDKNGVLGNGVRNDTTGQVPDHSKLNAYGENGYLGEKNDGANGKNIIFVGGSITSGVTGYTSIDNIGTDLLLAVPAYTNVTFEGVTFNNVMSFNYQLYTSPWSQLGELKFSGCTFNGLIVGSIAAQTLTFDGCVFTNYTNSASANNSNPTWIRPAYGNWSKGDNEGQGDNFKSLTTINFTNNKVTSTRPVKFERIAQWEMDTTVTVTGNDFDIVSDGSSKNVGLYFGANAKFDLVVDSNKKTDGTAALYTGVYTAPNGESYAGLPAGSTVKDADGNDVEVAGVIWKSTTGITLKTTTEAVEVGGVKFATLEEAFAAAKNGDTITLLSDVEMTETIRVTDGKKITLALNGFDVTITAKSVFIRVCNAELTITGKGTIKEQNPYFAPIIIKGGAEGSENYSVVNIKEGVTLEGWAGVMIDQTSGTANNYGMVLNVEGATLNGVNDTSGANGSGLYVNGVVKDAKITLTNTTVTGTGTGMYLAGNADTTINGGSVKGDATGIEIRAGKLTLNNCDVTGGNGEVKAVANDNGTTVTNAALAISQHTTKKPIEVIINGGTFNGTAAVYQTDVQGTGSADVKIAVKNGTFNGTISGETDGTIVISGGKFKVKVDDKYFADKLACSATPNADGYYTIADHPITKVGLTLSEDISIRIVVGAKYKDGKIKVTYETYDPNTKGMVTKELILDKYELAGTNKYQFRLSNITPQMADVVFTLQYLDSEGNEIGSAKQTSIIKYCEGLTETSSFEAYKAKVGQLLNYCATAMDFRAVSHADYLYNGLSWAERATALRAKISEYGYTVADIDFKTVGKYINRTRETIITGFGIEFAESVKLYYFIALDDYKDGYTYVADGLMTPVPVYEDGQLIGYRVYLTVAMDGYHTMRTLYVYDANGNEVQRIGMAPDYALKYLYNSGKQTNEFRQLCKAAYQYFVAFAE